MTHTELNIEFIFRAKKLSSLETVLYAGKESNLFDYVAYSNGQLSIRTNGGDGISGMIESLDVTFIGNPYNKQSLLITIKNGKEKFSFYFVPDIFTDEEWGEILYVLSCCGSVHGFDWYERFKPMLTTKGKALNTGKMLFKTINTLSKF